MSFFSPPGPAFFRLSLQLSPLHPAAQRRRRRRPPPSPPPPPQTGQPLGPALPGLQLPLDLRGPPGAPPCPQLLPPSRAPEARLRPGGQGLLRDLRPLRQVPDQGEGGSQEQDHLQGPQPLLGRAVRPGNRGPLPTGGHQGRTMQLFLEIPTRHFESLEPQNPSIDMTRQDF